MIIFLHKNVLLKIQLVIYGLQKLHRHFHNVLKTHYEGIIHKQLSRSIGEYRAEFRGNTL